VCAALLSFFVSRRIAPKLIGDSLSLRFALFRRVRRQRGNFPANLHFLQQYPIAGDGVKFSHQLGSSHRTSFFSPAFTLIVSVSTFDIPSLIAHNFEKMLDNFLKNNSNYSIHEIQSKIICVQSYTEKSFYTII
jgi:hypothetical protein